MVKNASHAAYYSKLSSYLRHTKPKIRLCLLGKKKLREL